MTVETDRLGFSSDNQNVLYLSEARVQYFSFPSPSGQTTCSDAECPCSKEPLNADSAFLYISSQVVTELRRDPETANAKPMVLCRDAARRRDLDLSTAAADAAHWWNTGSVAMRASPRRELKFKEFHGTTIEAAKESAEKELGADLIGTDVVRDVQETKATAQGATADAAHAAVIERLSPLAFAVQATQIIQEGGRGQVEAIEFDESDARRAWRREAPRGAELVKLETVSLPKKGIAGLGKKPGKWIAEWSAPYYAEVTYKMPAVVQARYFG